VHDTPHSNEPAEQAPGCHKLGSSACVLVEDGRTHHTVAARSSLAAHPRKDYFQTMCHGIQMPTQPGTSLSV